MTDSRVRANPNPDEQVLDWSQIVAAVAEGSPSAVEDLYRQLAPFRTMFWRALPYENVEDAFHELVIELIESVRRGAIRQPERLHSYAFTIARRKIVRCISQFARQRRTPALEDVVHTAVLSEASPEALVIRADASAVAAEVLASLSARDREILVRFYLREQPQERIKQEMLLSDTQFRLIKSRAKATFSRLLKKRLQQRYNQNSILRLRGIGED